MKNNVFRPFIFITILKGWDGVDGSTSDTDS